MLRPLQALLLTAVVLFVLAVLWWLTLPAVRDVEEEIRGRWGPLVSFDLPAHLSFDRPLPAALTGSLPFGRQRGVIYVLVRSSQSGMAELRRGLRLLHANFNHRARYPTVFFHEEEPSRARGLQQDVLAMLGLIRSAEEAAVQGASCGGAWQCRAINHTLDAFTSMDNQDAALPLPWHSPLCRELEVSPALCLPWTVIFAQVRLEFPPTMSPATQRLYEQGGGVEWDQRCQPTRLGYRMMCRLQTFIQYHPLIAAFEWYWRLDDDSELLSPLPYDPFELLSSLNKTIGWVTTDWEYDYCKDGLWEFLGPYRQRLLLAQGRIEGFDLYRSDDIIVVYNNFEIGRTAFWRRPEVRQLLAAVDRTAGTFRWRWGDAPIRTAAFSLFVPREQMFFLSQIHYRHELVSNFPEQSVERRVWWALLLSPLPLRWSFQLLSRIVLPSCLLLLLWLLSRDCRRFLEDLQTQEQPSRKGQEEGADVHRPLLSDAALPACSPSLAAHDAAAAVFTSTGLSLSSSSSSQHVVALDYLRCVSLLTVVFIHCIADSGLDKQHGRLEYFMHDVTRFAVPAFLFTAAFLASNDRLSPATPLCSQLWKSAERLLPAYLVASVLAYALFTLMGSPPFPLSGLPLGLLLGNTVQTYYFVFVLCYLSLLPPLLRRLQPKWSHWLLLASLLALIWFFRWPGEPGGSLVWFLRHPAVHCFPYLLGWVAGYHYRQHTAAPLPSASLASRLAVEMRLLVSQAIRLCRGSVMAVCLLVSVSALLFVQVVGRLDAHERNIPLQLHVWAAIATILCSTAAAPRLGGRLLWLNDVSFPLFLYHLLVVRLTEDAFHWVLPFPWYCLPLWATSVALSMALIRAMQLVVGPACPVLLGCSATDSQQRDRHALAQAPVRRRAGIIVCFVLLFFAASQLLFLVRRWYAAADDAKDWTAEIFSPADLALPIVDCHSSVSGLNASHFDPVNPFSLPASQLTAINSALDLAFSEWEGDAEALSFNTELMTRPRLMGYLRHWYAKEVSLVQVVAGVIRVFTHNTFDLPSSPFGFLANHRRRSFLDLLLSLTTAFGPAFPDVEFVLSTLDAPVDYVSDDRGRFWGFDRPAFFVQGHSPVFSVVRCNNSAAIVVPMRDDRLGGYEGWDDTACRIRASRQRFPPLQQRAKVAVLRGGVRACHLNASDVGLGSYTDQQFMFKGERWRECGRSGLVWQAFELDHKPYLFDIQLSSEIPELQALLSRHAQPGSTPALQLIEHQRSVAVLYAHGQCHWANRLEELLWMSSVVLLQLGQCQPWYALGLQPWLHYVPVDYNFRNASAAVEWVISHWQDAAAMVDRMNQYAQQMDTQAAASAYLWALVHRYAKLQPKPLLPLDMETMAEYSAEGQVLTYPDRYICDPDSAFWCDPWAVHD